MTSRPIKERHAHSSLAVLPDTYKSMPAVAGVQKNDIAILISFVNKFD